MEVVGANGVPSALAVPKSMRQSSAPSERRFKGDVSWLRVPLHWQNGAFGALWAKAGLCTFLWMSMVCAAATVECQMFR